MEDSRALPFRSSAIRFPPWDYARNLPSRSAPSPYTKSYFLVEGTLLRSVKAVITMKHRALFLLSAFVSLAIIAAGCMGIGTTTPLAGTTWTLTEIRNDAGNLVPVLTGTGVTAEFSADGRVTGFAGCNRYFAGYSTSGNRISVTDAGSTMMFCGDPEGLMVQESLFLGQLAASTAFRIEGTKLTLLEVGARPLLVFRPGTG